MVRNGLDLSHWNENEYFNQYVNWSELAKDPRTFEFIWLKCSEGELAYPNPDAYSVEVFERQLNGATSAGCFKQINPYHFYYYHVPWYYDSNGNLVYKVLSPTEQAKAFSAALKGKKFAHPLIDAEDPHIRQFLQWATTEQCNKAIAFARKINANFKAYVEAVEKELGSKPDIYTGDWWLDPWASFLVRQGYGAEVAWLRNYKFYIANYDNNGILEPGEGPIIPECLDRSNIIAWQWTSTPAQPVPSIPTPNNVDMAVWVGTESQWVEWSGSSNEGETTVANIHNTAVPIDKRGWVITLKSDQRFREGSSFKDTWSDALLLPMGGMRTALKEDGVNKYLELGADSTFEERCKIFSKVAPVGGIITLDPGALLREGWNATEVDKNMISGAELNKLSRMVIDSWHDGAWTIEGVFNGNGKWLPVSFILLKSMAVDAYPETAIIGNDWHNRVFKKVFDTIQYLIINEGAPDIPILLFCSDEKIAKLGDKTWLQYYYNGDLGVEIGNRLNKLYMAISKPTLDSTSTFTIPSQIFNAASDPTLNYLPADFKTKLLLFQFTVDKQCLSFIENKEGINTPIDASLWCEPRDKMYTMLKFTPSTTPPPVEPPVEPPVTPPTSTVTNDQIYAELVSFRKHIDEMWSKVFKT